VLKEQSLPCHYHRVKVTTAVIDPILSGLFVHEAFGHLSEADMAYENQFAGSYEHRASVWTRRTTNFDGAAPEVIAAATSTTKAPHHHNLAD